MISMVVDILPWAWRWKMDSFFEETAQSGSRTKLVTSATVRLDSLF